MMDTTCSLWRFWHSQLVLFICNMHMAYEG